MCRGKVVLPGTETDKPSGTHTHTQTGLSCKYDAGQTDVRLPHGV